MKRWIVGFFCLLLAWTASAGPNDVRKTAEASMLVTGWIEVAPDGSVHDYTIDRAEKIPPSVTDLIKKNVIGWKFHFDEPVNAIQRAKMYLRIKATPIDDQHVSIALSGATFGNGSGASSDQVSHKEQRPALPEYPREAIAARVTGTVYLILRVNRQGQVEDVAAEQVNLNAYGPEARMRHFRQVLANSAIEVAKKWTYNLPTTGKHVADPYWDVRVPVDYNLRQLGTAEEDTYGKWQPYIPGPREQIPWRTQTQIASSPDTIPAGSISQADSSMQLTTALNGA